MSGPGVPSRDALDLKALDAKVIELMIRELGQLVDSRAIHQVGANLRKNVGYKHLELLSNSITRNTHQFARVASAIWYGVCAVQHTYACDAEISSDAKNEVAMLMMHLSSDELWRIKATFWRTIFSAGVSPRLPRLSYPETALS
jgi:hypothetical protein